MIKNFLYFNDISILVLATCRRSNKRGWYKSQKSFRLFVWNKRACNRGVSPWTPNDFTAPYTAIDVIASNKQIKSRPPSSRARIRNRFNRSMIFRFQKNSTASLENCRSIKKYHQYLLHISFLVVSCKLMLKKKKNIKISLFHSICINWCLNSIFLYVYLFVFVKSLQNWKDSINNKILDF